MQTQQLTTWVFLLDEPTDTTTSGPSSSCGRRHAVTYVRLKHCRSGPTLSCLLPSLHTHLPPQWHTSQIGTSHPIEARFIVETKGSAIKLHSSLNPCNISGATMDIKGHVTEIRELGCVADGSLTPACEMRESTWFYGLSGISLSLNHEGSSRHNCC